MNKAPIFIALFLLGHFASAQTIWNKKLPFSSPASRPVSHVKLENDRLLMTTGGRILEFDPLGTVTGFLQASNSLYSTFVQRISSPAAQSPFFVVCTKGVNLNGLNAYTLALKNTEDGSLQTLNLSDSLGASANAGPALVEIDAQTFWVLGRKFVRKFKVSNQAVLSLEWEKSLNLPAQNVTNAAVLRGNRVYTVTNQGFVQSFDLDGNLIWSKNYQNSYVFRGLTTSNDGLVACGTAISGGACIVKLNWDGDLLWESTPGDVAYNDIHIQADGSIVTTGSTGTTNSSNIVLVKSTATGNPIWKQSYQAGLGNTLTEATDGGYFLTAFGPQGAIYVIKTNVLGESTPLDASPLSVEGRTLKNDNISLVQRPSTSLFLDNTGTSLQIPADSMTSSIYSFSPWIAGKDNGGNLYLSASTYGQPNFDDLKLGIGTGNSRDFNRVWLLKKVEIDRLRQDFGADGVLDQPIPFDLLTWPAKGNPQFRWNLDFSACTTTLDSLPAPFVDANGDGLYNVYDGDYPKITGNQMIWWAISDQAPHNQSNGQALNVDLLISVYLLDCTQNEALSYSIFSDINVINRSLQSYSESYLGFFTDFDLGCSDDDFLGAIPETNSVYAYNADAVDGSPGSSCAGGVSTYNDQIPVQSITMLNQSLDHSMYYNRGGAGVPAGTTDPSTPFEHYNLLQSRWRDGLHLTVGGDGYNPLDPFALPIEHAFPGNPSNPNDWTMCSAFAPPLTVADRRALFSHGPFDFQANDSFLMQLAFSFHPNIPHPCPDIAGLVKPEIQQIQQWHDDGLLDSPLDLGGVLNLIPGQSLLLNATQPNPATNYAWSTGQNTPSILVTQAGEYTVTVTPATGCSFVETVLVKYTSGVNNPTLPEWTLQPNPANDLLNIVFESAEMPITAVLRNAQGQLVATKNSSNSHLEISVVNLPTGLYWAELWQEGKFLGSRKVVVAR